MSFRAGYSRGVRVHHVAAAAVVAFAGVGCGAKATSVYRIDATAGCLRDAGYRVRTDADHLGIVAAAAPLGALRAFEPGNNVTISFGNNHAEAVNVSKLYRKFAPKKLRPHIDDVMEIQKNAVLLWIVTPPVDDHDKVVGCLKA
jgi:hypothetical protein